VVIDGHFVDLLKQINMLLHKWGHDKQHIQVDIIYMFHFGLPWTCFYSSPQHTPFWRRGAGARKVYFRTLLKTFPWKSKMKHVVKHDVNLDILFMVSIYVTTSLCLFVFQWNSGNRPIYYPTLGESMQLARLQQAHRHGVVGW